MIAIFSWKLWNLGITKLVNYFSILRKRQKKYLSIISIFNFIFSTKSFFLFMLVLKEILIILAIHQSWQSWWNNALYFSLWKGTYSAIAAIGWGTSQVFTSSLLSQFNLFIFWHPGMWFLTIHLAMRLFIGEKDVNQKLKRTIVCSQLSHLSPCFYLLILVDGYLCGLLHQLYYFHLMNIWPEQTIVFHQLLEESKYYKIIPEFNSSTNYNYILLFFGILLLLVSWRYLVSNQ